MPKAPKLNSYRSNAPAPEPFWKTRTLREMSRKQWESLCDGCGKCCLHKLEDWDTAEIYWTNLACKLLDGDSCQCSNYKNRFDFVPDCIKLTPSKVEKSNWLPPTCAYRLIREGRDLYWWHPLVSGDPETVHQAGVSARGRSLPETGIDEEDFEDYQVDWVGREYEG